MTEGGKKKKERTWQSKPGENETVESDELSSKQMLF